MSTATPARCMCACLSPGAGGFLSWSSAMTASASPMLATLVLRMTAMAYGSAYYALPGGCSPYPYAAYTYYNCGGAYYQPQYEGDTIVYVSTPDPSTVTVQQ